MINVISTQDELFKDYIFDDDEKVIKNLSQINIFIGENNSGKSRFLRGIFSVESLTFEDDEIPTKHIINIAEEFKKEFEVIFIKYLIDKRHFENFKNNFYQSLDVELYIDSKNYNKLIFEYSVRVKNFVQLIQNIDLREYGLTYSDSINVKEDLLKLTQQFSLKINLIIDNIKVYNFPKNFYIPILRTMRNLEGGNEILIKTIIKNYFEHKFKSDSEFIFTGQNLYKRILDSKNSDLEFERENFNNFLSFLHLTFFKSKPKFEIISVNTETGKIKINFGKGDEFEIPFLGDGIQSIILLLYPIFMKQGEKALFFIEEPELNLHPGMQRVFLETLLDDRFKDMQFFFTTHSNHFLDLTLETDKISVYHFNKNKDGKFMVKNSAHGDDNILKSLGIRNSSVFLTNCTIWVEGITDRKYIRKYLERYFEEHKLSFIEDLHYSFVEYAGSNLTHWNFEEENGSDNILATKLNQNIFLIVDSDADVKGTIPEPKQKRNKKLKEILGEKFYVTKGKEIENSLSVDVICNIVKEYEGKDFDLVKFKGKIEKKDYLNLNIGKLIDETLDNDKKRKSNYSFNNTISDKTNFCEKALSHMNEYDDLGDEAKNIAKLLADFINKHNGK